ncbi:MAG: hypothetical protein HC768_14100 [Acaryochloris sp. CRU_2_0]|nr:hypothetical protein [Acaryochloris sp. CRU_2_0]
MKFQVELAASGSIQSQTEYLSQTLGLENLIKCQTIRSKMAALTPPDPLSQRYAFQARYTRGEGLGVRDRIAAYSIHVP